MSRFDQKLGTKAEHSITLEHANVSTISVFSHQWEPGKAHIRHGSEKRKTKRCAKSQNKRCAKSVRKNGWTSNILLHTIACRLQRLIYIRKSNSKQNQGGMIFRQGKILAMLGDFSVGLLLHVALEFAICTYRRAAKSRDPRYVLV